MDDLTWCIQRIKPMERWKNIFQFAKEIELWFIALGTFFIGISIVYFITEYEKKPLDYVSIGLTIALAVMGSPSRFRPITLFGRCWFAFTLYITLVLNTYFHSFLIIILTHDQYDHQLSTVMELIDNDYEIVGESFALARIKDHNLVIVFVVLVFFFFNYEYFNRGISRYFLL